VIDLDGRIVRLAGVFCDNRTTRLARKGARKTLLYCTVFFALKWVFWQNNDFNKEYCWVLAPFPLETNRFFSGWELSEVKKGSLTGGVGGDSCQVPKSSSGPTSFRILRRDRFGGLYRAIGIFTFSGSKTNWRKQWMPAIMPQQKNI
jgi:hypothetical protein